MPIELSKVVVCFYVLTTVVAPAYVSYNNRKDRDDRSPKKYHQPEKYHYSSNSYNNHNNHQSRYTNLNRIMTRIDKMNNESESVGLEQDYKLRHKGRMRPTTTTTTRTTTTTTDEELFNTYGEFENEDYDDEFEDEKDDTDSYDYDDGFFDSVDDNEDEYKYADQAEPPTVPPRPVSALTKTKWGLYGTPERVQESRRIYMQESTTKSTKQNRVQDVLSHFMRVKNDVKCQKPLPKVISIQKEFPDASKTYIPHCTMLHRCDDDTGCCKSGSKCDYKTREQVNLSFYVISAGFTEKTIETLSFFNHSACECKDTTNSSSVRPVNVKQTYLSTKLFYGNLQSVKRCKCPSLFESSREIDNKCICDCKEGNFDCILLKKGKEHLGMLDRKCIIDEECGTPSCEFGAYMKDEGMCPGKRAKVEDNGRLG